MPDQVLAKIDTSHVMTTALTPITVSKSELKPKMLEYFRHVELKGEELIVTSNKESTIKIVPIKPKLPLGKLFDDVAQSAVLDINSILEPETGD